MTDLQLGLLVIGAVVVVGVFAYNRYQERRASRAAARAFTSPSGDALLEARRPSSGPAADVPATTARATEPAVTSACLPDERIDYVAALAFDTPVAAGDLRERWKPFEHRYAKRALLACQSADGEWLRLEAARSVAATGLRAGLQLVTCDGPVNEAELIEFRAAVDSLAASTGAAVGAPEMRQAVERARDLDQFCAAADIQVVLHVVPAPERPFRVDRLEEAAEAAGLESIVGGRLALPGGAGRVRFTVAARDGGPVVAGGSAGGNADGLSLSLDVARTADTPGSFQALAEFARQLAASTGGTLVDDNGRELDERAWAAIEAQLGELTTAFAQRGIEPGGELALRLFA